MDDDAPKTAGKPKPPRPVTADWLFRAAAHYLERYASSTANLRRVLLRKVARRARARDEDPEAFSDLVDETVARFAELKLVDDRSFAEGKLASLRRRGTSLRMAEAKLMEKGVERDLVDAVLAGDETSERAAAMRYAERRRLGPHRLRDRRARRDRDVAAMVRAGFPYGLAAQVIDGGGAQGGDDDPPVPSDADA